MNAPQIVVLVMLSLSVGISWEQHGKERTGKHNGWYTFVAVLIQVALLWWGGFWS